MCGLVGLLTTDGSPSDPVVLRQMAAVIEHRGPDDAGFECSGAYGLGFRRLSILDLSPAGHQPMTTPDGSATVVFNGEIYNYLELRQELESLGHRFRSSGDTEVLLHAYLQWGQACLSRLNGMWAFLIHDRRQQKLFGSRDRVGIKPLYVYRGPKHLLLASEIKAIRASGLYQEEVNWRAAASYLAEGRLDETHDTFYRGIEQVPPGTAFEADARGGYRQWRFWTVPQDGARNTPGEPASAFADLFEDAIDLHMRSDVPVGVNLSGGLDSTSIICASARTRAKSRASGELLAFCYMAPEFDESGYINDTLAQSEATLVKLETSAGRIWSDLQRALWFQDEPVHSFTAVIGYQLMDLARGRGIKVILNGQGADETLGGYFSYFRDYWHTLLAGGHLADFWQEIGRFTSVHGGTRGTILRDQLKHLILGGLGKWSWYRRVASERRRRDAAHNTWFTAELTGQLPEQARASDWSLDAVLARSVSIAPLPLYLRVEDRNSMAHSIEVRLPFLDYRLIELAFSLPPDWKLRGPWNKYVLRQGMTQRIPDSVRTRLDKMGFPVPARTWLADALYEPVRDLLSSRAMKERGIYRGAEIQAALDRHRRGEADESSLLFRVAQFELWSSVCQGASTVPEPAREALHGGLSPA